MTDAVLGIDVSKNTFDTNLGAGSSFDRRGIERRFSDTCPLARAARCGTANL
jgi:hypothetical protein